MSYLEAIDWTKLKKDVELGWEKGLVAARKGALVVKKKAGDLTEEGKRQYKILSLKSRVHSQMADLGAQVYTLMGARARNPALDARVKDIVAQIRKNEVQISALMKEAQMKPKKRVA